MKLSILNEDFELLPERAFYWEKEKLLGFSDVHVGKAESLQKMGIPVPTGSHSDDFNKIRQLIDRYEPQKILILGDWIHQKDSWTVELLEEMKSFFLSYSEIEWILLIGNHERGSRSYLEELPIQIVEGSYSIGDFDFTHGHISDESKRFRIEGHVHPVVTLSDGPLRMKFPCFVLDSERLLIPSFGSLTGGAEVSRVKKERLFAVTPQEVFEIR